MNSKNSSGEYKNWNNLLKDCCPICSYKMRQGQRYHPTFPNVQVGTWICENPQCHFMIGDSKKRELTDKINDDLIAAGMGPEIQIGDEDDGILSTLPDPDVRSGRLRSRTDIEAESILDPDGNYRRLMEL